MKRVETTLGIDFFTKTISVNNIDVQLSLWDTAGTERFRSLMHSYLHDAEIAILVYDTSKRECNLVQWMRVIEQHNAKVVGILGNKTDLTTEFDSDLDEILFPWIRQDWQIVKGTCSSRNSDEVKSYLKKCIQHLMDGNETHQTEFNVQLKPELPQKNKCCT